MPSVATLKLFLQVAKSSSFSETARIAAVSQPALSRTIRLLEENLGVRLFDRDTRNVRLTAAGELLLPAVQRLVRDYEDTFAELAQSFSGERGRVAIGALPSMAANLLPRALTDFCGDHPHVELTIHEGLSGNLLQQMLDRRIDIAIMTPPDRTDQFAFEAMLNDECVLVAKRGELATSGPAHRWTIFEDHPFIAMAPQSSVRRLTDRALAQAGVVAKPRFECAQLATVGGFIVAGLGISAVPRSTLPLLSQPDIEAHPLCDPVVHRQIGITTTRQRSLSPAARLLKAHLSQRLTVNDPLIG
ncbi:LysR family transcriptional regulator [Sphingomonas sp. ac-8]|uniref:LysR family transcriptional regulator n=1 Tax=Sphingomonas sp. ac-8 TaxID=3242977 RepID=UPI003A806D4A